MELPTWGIVSPGGAGVKRLVSQYLALDHLQEQGEHG
jgi:hypothetical protein